MTILREYIDKSDDTERLNDVASIEKDPLEEIMEASAEEGQYTPPYVTGSQIAVVTML